MSNKKFAVCTVVLDRWDLTKQTFDSLGMSEQDINSYDLFVVSNGSNKETVAKLKEYFSTSHLPLQNLLIIPEPQPVSTAYNLGWLLMRDYPYRVKLDNDVLVNRLPLTKTARIVAPPPGGANPGAIPNASIVKGIGQIHRRKFKEPHYSTRFLDYIADASEQNKTDLTALVPVAPGDTFGWMMGQVTACSFAGRPFLFGACMGVTKAGFDKIGYFDERLERKIDTDYSIRAIRQGLNIGYHHGVGVTHIGVGKTTEDGEQFQKRSTHANEIMGTDQATGFVHSMWEIIADRLDRASKRNVVLNITGADKLSKGEPPPPEESV